MEGVKEVTQLNDKRLHWHANVGGKEKEWDAEITEQVPDQRIAWKNLNGTTNAGIVTFHRLSDDRTRIMLQVEYEPEGVVENVGDMLGVVSARVRGDLQRFKDFIESRGRETGAWRGEIQQPNKQRKGSSMKEQTEKQQSAASEGGQQSTHAMPPHDEQSGQQPREMRTNGEQRDHQRGMMRRDWLTPTMRRFSDEMDRFMDRFFTDFGFGRGWPGVRWGHSRESGQSMWSPQIEVSEHDNQLIICADLPGLKKEDIKVEFSDDTLTIQGERRQEYEQTQEGYQRSERSYGSFYRSIPLPKGIDPGNAKATFQDGVLKVTMPMLHHEERRSRRIEIQGSDEQQSHIQAKSI
jgi:HSP20 family molecular chaperone IbpA